MPNTHNPQSFILKELLTRVQIDLDWLKLPSTDITSKFGRDNIAVDVALPVALQGGEGWDVTGRESDIINQEVRVTKKPPVNVLCRFSPEEMQYYYDNRSQSDMPGTDFRSKTIENEFIEPAAKVIANMLNERRKAEYFRAWNRVGVVGTPVTTWDQLSDVSMRLDDMGVSKIGRKYIANNASVYKLANQLGFSQIQDKNGNAYQRASIGTAQNLELLQTVDQIEHLTGNFAGTIQTNAANSQVTYTSSGKEFDQTIDLKGFTASQAKALRSGDTFTIAGVFAVDPRQLKITDSKKPRSYLQQFTVLADADANATGVVTATISPKIITSGPYQTVSVAGNAIAASVAITMNGPANTVVRESFAYGGGANAWCHVNMAIPQMPSVEMSTETVMGLTGTLTRGGVFNTMQQSIRFDIDYTPKLWNPWLACRHIAA